MLPSYACGAMIGWEGEMWKSEERKKKLTTRIRLTALYEQTLTELSHRFAEATNYETRTRYKMLLLSARGQTSVFYIVHQHNSRFPHCMNLLGHLSAREPE
jgi:lysyl-tRNA synthetase class II